MTPEEAKTKVCPFMSNSVAVDHPDFRDGGLIPIKCITSDCIAWEWEEEFDSRASSQRSESSTNGYCKRLGK